MSASAQTAMFLNRRSRDRSRIQMKVLLVGLTGTEPAFLAWVQWLARAGVPFDAVALKDGRPLEFVDDSGAAAYQGLILADAGVVDMALEPSQRADLEHLERDLGLRRLIAYTTPGPEHGLTPPLWSGHPDELEPTLTARGREIFPYMRERLPIDPGSWAYLAAPESSRFETLIAGPEGAALLGIHRHLDGREEMVQLFNANAGQAQGQLLRRGQLAWLTGGTYVGIARHYLSVEIDDVLLPNHSWNVETHESDLCPEAWIRMTARDADYASDWVRERGLRLDLACNGAGSANRRAGSEGDPLLVALLAGKDSFGWINHTYEHRDLDEESQATIEAEIERNLGWADDAGLEFEPRTLVTGAHTGLANLDATPARDPNPNLAAALRAQRIRYIGCDASRPYAAGPGGTRLAPGTPFMVGTTLAVPRHPTILPHDAATQAQVLDRLRSDSGLDVHSWHQVVAAEARRIFNAVISNDPRPHYFHQSNLVGAYDRDSGEAAPGLVYTLLDAVLDRYQEYVAPDVPIVQPRLGEIGRTLLRTQAWRAVLEAGSVTAYVAPDHVTIVNRSTSTLEVPLTGTVLGEEYGATNSGWISVMPGETRIERRPAVAGDTRANYRARSSRTAHRTGRFARTD